MRLAAHVPQLRLPSGFAQAPAVSAPGLWDKGAVDFGSGIAHVATHRIERGVGQHGAFQLQQIALRCVFVKNVAEIAKARFQAHHPTFAQAVDRRVGHLAEGLAEEVVHAPVAIGQHGDRRIIAHRADGFLAAFGHRLEDHLHIFHAQPEAVLTTAQLFAARTCCL